MRRKRQDSKSSIRDLDGYILNGSQNYLEVIPVENILAIYEKSRLIKR